MALTGKIRVKNVQAADPQLVFTLESEDGGTFPAHVKTDASLDGGRYSGSQTKTGGAVTDVNFDIQFTDPDYPSQTQVSYDLTIYFPDGQGGWRQFTGTVDGASGTVPANH